MKEIIKILKYRNRHDLAELLKNSIYQLNESGTFGSMLFSRLTTVEIYSPIQDYDKLNNLSSGDVKEILNAFLIIYPIKPNDIEINNIEFYVDPHKEIPVKDELIPESDIVTDYWTNNYFRLFISHHSKIKEKANSLRDHLKNFGICGFVAHVDIEPTKNWQFIIESALISCNCLIAYLTDEFHSSKWTDQELGIAYGLGKKIISIRAGANPYGFIGKFQALNMNQKSMKLIANEIFSILVEDENLKKELSQGVVEMFINSFSYKDAINNLKVLQKLKYLDKNLIEKLEASIKENRQIKKSFGVPEKLKNFLSNFE